MATEPITVIRQSLTATADGRLTAEQAAQYLGLAPQTLCKWRSLRRGPAYIKLGKISYRLADLDDWISQSRVDPAIDD